MARFIIATLAVMTLNLCWRLYRWGGTDKTGYAAAGSFIICAGDLAWIAWGLSLVWGAR